MEYGEVSNKELSEAIYRIREAYGRGDTFDVYLEHTLFTRDLLMLLRKTDSFASKDAGQICELRSEIAHLMKVDEIIFGGSEENYYQPNLIQEDVALKLNEKFAAPGGDAMVVQHIDLEHIIAMYEDAFRPHTN